MNPYQSPAPIEEPEAEPYKPDAWDYFAVFASTYILIVVPSFGIYLYQTFGQ